MSMYVTFKMSGPGENLTTEQYHVGNKLTKMSPSFYVVELQADCDELDYILDSFDWIPRPAKLTFQRVVRWFGDHARFIYNNLDWE